jgi:hypothetical protein
VRTQAQVNAQAQAQLEAACIQTIYITLHANGNDPADPGSYNVTAPLRFEFIDVYLRQPIEGVNEGDIVIDIAELPAFAVDFWLTNAE